MPRCSIRCKAWVRHSIAPCFAHFRTVSRHWGGKASIAGSTHSHSLSCSGCGTCALKARRRRFSNTSKSLAASAMGPDSSATWVKVLETGSTSRTACRAFSKPGWAGAPLWSSSSRAASRVRLRARWAAWCRVSSRERLPSAGRNGACGPIPERRCPNR